MSPSVLNQKLHGQIYRDTRNLRELPPSLHDTELAPVGKEPAASQDILSKGSFLYKKKYFV